MNGGPLDEFGLTLKPARESVIYLLYGVHHQESHHGRLVNVKSAAKCLYAEVEGPHKVACREPATGRSSDNYPTCPEHTGEAVRRGWKGFVKGA